MELKPYDPPPLPPMNPRLEAKAHRGPRICPSCDDRGVVLAPALTGPEGDGRLVARWCPACRGRPYRDQAGMPALPADGWSSDHGRIRADLDRLGTAWVHADGAVAVHVAATDRDDWYPGDYATRALHEQHYEQDRPRRGAARRPRWGADAD